MHKDQIAQIFEKCAAKSENNINNSNFTPVRNELATESMKISYLEHQNINLMHKNDDLSTRIKAIKENTWIENNKLIYNLLQKYRILFKNIYFCRLDIFWRKHSVEIKLVKERMLELASNYQQIIAKYNINYLYIYFFRYANLITEFSNGIQLFKQKIISEQSENQINIKQ